MPKMFIFLTLFLSTQQKLYWNFISWDELSSKGNITMFDLSQFKMYNNSDIPTNRFCLIFLSVGDVFISEGRVQYDWFMTFHWHGLVSNGQFLRSYDNRDALIFVLLEGCYSIDENGSNSPGAVLVTNYVNKKYQEKVNIDYFWTIIESHQIDCNMFCKGVVFGRCFLDMNDIM